MTILENFPNENKLKTSNITFEKFIVLTIVPNTGADPGFFFLEGVYSSLALLQEQ